MSTLLPKRSWTKRPRLSHVAPEVISSAPCDTSTESISDSKDSVKSKETAQKDEALLKSTKTLVYDASELFSHRVTLSDPRIQAIRRQVENAMPRLYDLSQDCSPSHTSSETSLIMRIAEDFLKKFPDATSTGVLRPHNEEPMRIGQISSAATRLSPIAIANVPETISPPQAPLTQPAVPNTRQSQPAVPCTQGAAATSSMHASQILGPPHSPVAQSLARPHPISSAAHQSPATPPPSAILSQSSSYSDTRIPYMPGLARPPLWGSCYETSTPGHLYEALKHTTQHQKMVLFAVHELLQKRSSQYGRQAWYEPPIGLSPEELLCVQERRNDAQIHRPNIGGQFQQYIPPAHPSHSPAGTPYPFHGSRSLAIAQSMPRSASLK